MFCSRYHVHEYCASSEFTGFDLQPRPSRSDESLKKKTKLKTKVSDLEVKVEDQMSFLKQMQIEYEVGKNQLEHLSTGKERKEELLQSLQTGVLSKEGHA